MKRKPSLGSISHLLAMTLCLCGADSWAETRSGQTRSGQTRSGQTRSGPRVDSRGRDRIVRVRPVIRAGLFDLDGTLVESKSLIGRMQQRALAEAGHELTLNKLHTLFGIPFNGKAGRAGILQKLGIPEGQRDSIEARYRALLKENVRETEKVERADELLRSLAANGVRQAIVTNTKVDRAEQILEVMGWRSSFEHVIGQGEQPLRPKPDPQPALIALSKLRVDARESAFVGDTPYDMACGASAGCSLRIGLLGGGRTFNELTEAGATHVVSSLEDVRRLMLGAELPAH